MAKKKRLERLVDESSKDCEVTESRKVVEGNRKPSTTPCDGRKFQKRIKGYMGKNLPKVLSRSLVKSPYEAIGELCRNAYDEDATEFHVDTDAERGTITVTDNGLGMNERGLENFFRLAGSYKTEEPVSPKGRKRIGK